MWIAVADFRRLRIGLGELGGVAAGCRDLPQSGGVCRRVVDDVIGRPRAAARVSGIGEFLKRCAADGHLFQLASREEANPSAIRRKEGAPRVVGAVERFGHAAGNVVDEQLRPSRAGAGKRHRLTIRRNRQRRHVDVGDFRVIGQDDREVRGMSRCRLGAAVLRDVRDGESERRCAEDDGRDDPGTARLRGRGSLAKP